MGCMKQGREHCGSQGQDRRQSGPEPHPCHPAQGPSLSIPGEYQQDEGRGPTDGKPEGGPRQVMVLTLPIWAASSVDRVLESAGQCLTLPRTELGAVEARL